MENFQLRYGQEFTFCWAFNVLFLGHFQIVSHYPLEYFLGCLDFASPIIQNFLVLQELYLIVLLTQEHFQYLIINYRKVFIHL
jgi:hypothetical protein